MTDLSIAQQLLTQLQPIIQHEATAAYNVAVQVQRVQGYEDEVNCLEGIIGFGIPAYVAYRIEKLVRAEDESSPLLIPLWAIIGILVFGAVINFFDALDVWKIVNITNPQLGLAHAIMLKALGT